MSAALDEKTITHTHDVGFVNSRHPVATVSLGILEGKLGHSVTQIISMIVSNLSKTCKPSQVLKNVLSSVKQGGCPPLRPPAIKHVVPVGCGLCDELDGLDDSIHDFVFDAGVFALSVFPVKIEKKK